MTVIYADMLIRRFVWAGTAVAGLLVLGTLGYILVEKWSFIDALWMTVITMSTVGYGEVAPLDPAGRLLTIFLILSTILVGGFAVTNISAFLVEGELVSILRGRRVARLEYVGADQVILPSRIGGRRLATFQENPEILEFLDLVTEAHEISLRLEGFTIAPTSTLSGLLLKDSRIRETSGGALVMAIKRSDGKLEVPPPPNLRLRSGDIIITLGTEETLKKVCELTGQIYRPKKVK